jgi:predicted  nucleic acid-binding Zn-ribbon protein
LEYKSLQEELDIIKDEKSGFMKKISELQATLSQKDLQINHLQQ